MRIVLDENLPRPLKRAFSSIHVVMTVQELGFVAPHLGTATGPASSPLDRRS